MLLAALAVTLATAACGDDVAGQPTAPGTNAPAKAEGKAENKPESSSGEAKTIDACTLLTAEEVTAIIGNNNGGAPTGGVGESICGWENPENYHSITVGIGGRDTAANGTLPPKEPPFTGEPGPDGTEFFAGGVDFVADKRACYVQVVTDAGKQEERDTALGLVKLIRGRVGS